MPLENLQNGRYEFLELLGSGSMGEVYLVDDTVIDRKVAIKLMRVDPTAQLDTEAIQNSVKLFKREAQAIAKLEHPNILPLYDFGEEKQEHNIFTYMVMPYCQEGSLLNWLQLHHPKEALRPEIVGYLIELAANALQYAHDHGIIHQDVKPSNFLVRTHTSRQDIPDLLLADFGIAKVSTGTTVNTTNFGPRGTPRYMPPEQWEGKPLPASDQYALAVMAYQLLTLAYPLQGEQLHQMMYQHFYTVPQPPGKLNPHIPALLDAVILRALAKKPEERFPSINAFATAFQRAIQEKLSPVQMSSEFATDLYQPDISEASTEATQNTSPVPLPGPLSGLSTLDHSAPTQQNANHSRQPVNITGPNYAMQPVRQLLQQAPVPSTNVAQQQIIASVPTTSLPQSVWTKSELNNTPVPFNRATKARQGTSKGKLLLLIGLTLIVILTGGGLAYHFFTGTSPNSQGNVYTNSMPTLRYTDSLDQPNHWININDSTTGGGCNFQPGNYHVTTNKAGTYTLCHTSNQPVVSDMTFEVQMQILKGDCGGIVFRGDLQTDHYYYFDLCSSGGYYLCTYNGTNNASGPLLPAPVLFPALQANVQAKITVAIVAQGNSLTFYLNHQQVAHINDSTYTRGQISLFAYSGVPEHVDATDPTKEITEVVFSNARLWTP